MTVTLNITTVTAYIKTLQISGVTIVDYDGYANSWKSQPNVMYLNPEGAVMFEPPDYAAIGRGDNAAMDMTYTLNYRFLGTQLGNVGDVTGHPAMLDKVYLIINELAGEHNPASGLVLMELGRITVGARTDPVGNMYHGADIAIRCTEQQN